MKDNSKDLKAIAQKVFNAYDAHDVEGMLAFCAPDAQGRYAPYGLASVMPIRGGIDVIWRAFPQAVPKFRVEVIELLLAEGSIVVAQAVMSGPIRADPFGLAKDGQDVHIPHCYVLRFDKKGMISHLDAYWDNAVLQGVQKSAL